MSAKCRLITAKDGNKVPVITHEGKEVRLGSLYDGRYAAERWAKRYISDGTENVILFGLGDGQLVRLLTEIVPGKILVYEPNDALYREMRHTSAFKKIQANKRVKIYAGEDGKPELVNTARELLDQNAIDTTVLRSHFLYYKYYQKEFEWLKNICDEAVDKITMMFVSVRRFAPPMIRNLICNVKYMEGGIPLMRLAKYWNPDIPVIIVSAGPSLEKNLMWLKEARGRAFIFCADAALNLLLQHNIIPDVAACTDANKNLKNFTDDRIQDITLLITSSAPIELVGKNKSNRIWGSTEPYMESIFRICGIEYPKTEVPLGVATLMLASLLDLGTRRIIFCGQDLAYSPDGSSHIAGHNEGFQRREEYDAEGYEGGIVYSRYDWTITREWIEQMIQQFPDRKYINATEGGARIQGTEQKSLKEAIMELEQKDLYWKDVLEDKRIYITSEEYGQLKRVMIKEREDLVRIRQLGYEQAMLEEKESFVVTDLILAYMRGLKDGTRKERFQKALDYVEHEFEKEVSAWRK